MPATPPDAAVASQLATALTAAGVESTTWAVNTNIFLGPVLPAGSGVPDEAIFCLANGGPPPDPVLGSVVGGDFSRPIVQVWVRSSLDSGAFASGEALAAAVQAALHKASLVGYLSCLAQQAQPIYMQTDSAGHHEFALNFELWVLE